MELKSCRVLVTGASGGIGQALVEQLCLAGAQVLAVSRDAGALSAAMARFPEAPAPRRRRSWQPRRGSMWWRWRRKCLWWCSIA
jgi:uncharacterized protein YbjT (DUF2867 family)